MTDEDRSTTGASQYLLVLRIAERRRSGPVPPGDVAAAVDRSPSATTEMLQRLEERNLVSYEPYDGARLTTEGREAVEELFETYVTLAVFFRDVLDLDDFEAEALRVAGAISPAVADRLASTLPLETASSSDDDRPVPSPL
ncbi:metal-dependent transcriptional regulator [Natronoarchaeum mannanilyticum]|uniref:Metal-dependent transcriptional regulator n=1 Tax=Natronoarchaeum mannanilyticum TaxID=926360 RepID=A0AAV3T5M7_9EURY